MSPLPPISSLGAIRQLLKERPFSAKKALLFSSAFFLVNLVLKGWFLGSQDIALDEPFTLFWAQRPVEDILALARNENNPPLHFLIEHFWIQWVGMEAGTVRIPSLLFGSACAAVMFRIGYRHLGCWAGILAGCLATLSTEHVYYAHEARVYALLALLTALSIGSYLNVLAGPRHIAPYIWLGIWNTLLMYSHFLGMWVLLAQAACWWLAQERWTAARRLLLVYMGVVLAYLPNLYVFWLRLQSVSTAGTWVPAPHWTQLYGHVNIFWNGPWSTVACIAICGAALLWIAWKRRWVAAWQNLGGGHRVPLVLLALVGVPYIGMYMQSLLFNPVFIPRYLFFCSVPFFLCVAAWVSAILPTSAARLCASALLLIALLPGLRLDPPNHRDIQGMVAHVQATRTPGTPLVIAPDYFDKTYLYHADRELFQEYSRLRAAEFAQGIYPVNGGSALPPHVLQAQRVIFLDADVQFVFPGNGILEGLRKHFPHVHSRSFESALEVHVLERVPRP